MTPDAASRLNSALADRYRIERELGQGGMATVYLAHDIKHERQVAIKVLREDLSASLGSGRFLREIKIAAQLQHPHILPLLDSGEAEGFLYFVMPYIKGQSLRERIAREGELPVHEAVRLLTEVVDALVEAHEHGVVHRDIKPDNVMLSGRHALVTDFGVAKAISEATGRNTVTTLGVAVGTPTYMSPEQAAADPHVDHRSDIYSVGVMAYEMLSGKPPFTGGSPQQVLAAHVTEAPDSVAKRRPAIPPALEQIVMRCLAKRPADRYQTAVELHAALEPLATPSTGITPTQTRPISAVQARSRTPWLVAAGVAVIAAIAFVATRGGSSASAPIPSAITAQATTSGNVQSPSISPDGTRIAYVISVCDTTGHCLHDLVVQDLGGAGTLTVMKGANGIYRETWSPDSRYLSVYAAFPDRWGTFRVPTTVQGQPTYHGCCSASFLVTADTMLQVALVLPTDTIGYVRILTTDGRPLDSIRIDLAGAYDHTVYPSPDGKRFALSILHRSGPGTLKLAGRDGRITDTMSVSAVGRVAWTPGGTSIVYTAPIPRGVDRYDVIQVQVDRNGRFTARTDTLLHGVPMLAGEFAITADGETLAYANVTRTNNVLMLRRTDLASSRFAERTIATSTGRLGGGISPDGKRIVLLRSQPGAAGRFRMQFTHMPVDSGAEVLISPVLDSIPGAGWSPEDSPAFIYSFPVRAGVDQLTRFDLQTGRTTPLFTVVDSTGNLGFLAVSGGRFLTRQVLGRDWSLLSATGALERTIKLPAEASDFTGTPTRSAAGDEIAIVTYNASTQDSVVVYKIRLSDGSAREVAAIPAEVWGGLQWLDNGDLLLVLGETRENFVLYRIGSTGALQRIGPLPHAGIAQYTISRDGLRMVVTLSDPHGDVWLVKNFGKMWRK